MMKKSVFSMTLVAALIPLVQSAPAQKITGTPKPAISDYGPFTGMKYKNTTTRAASGKCGNPAESCLFYGGDFFVNPVGSNLANGLANETTLEIGGAPYGAATWVPFTVPAGQNWLVGGLFSNNQSTFGVLDQAPLQPTSAAYWAINEGVTAGNAGTTIVSGTSAATVMPTGRSAFGDNEFTVEVKGAGFGFVLSPGTYWMAVVPICSNPADPYCEGSFFVSDVEYVNSTPANAYGPAEPQDASYLDSPYFGLSFDPANGELGACGGIGCDAFSVGVLGIKMK